MVHYILFYFLTRGVLILLGTIINVLQNRKTLENAFSFKHVYRMKCVFLVPIYDHQKPTVFRRWGGVKEKNLDLTLIQNGRVQIENFQKKTSKM